MVGRLYTKKGVFVQILCKKCVKPHLKPHHVFLPKGRKTVPFSIPAPPPFHSRLPFHSPPLFHSRESGNLFPRQREIYAKRKQLSPVGECGYRRRDSGFRRNGSIFLLPANVGVRFPPPPPFPFPRKRESLPAPAGNLREAETSMSPVGECGYRRRDSRFRGNGSIFIPPAFAGMEVFFLPSAACGGGVRARSGRGGWSISDDVWNFATPQKFAGANFYPPPQAAEGEIPACAGMERGAGMGIRGENGGAFNFAALLSTSIPAKAGISFSRQREFSAKRNIAMVTCRRMRLRRRDSGFRRNGRYFLSPAAGGERGEREAGAGG